MKTLGDIFGVKIEKDMAKKRPMRVEDIDCSSRLEKYFKEHNGKIKHGDNKMREQFEKLPEIKAILKKGVFEYTDFTKSYNFIDAMTCINARPSQHKDHGYLNGAWYSFQEQQKKIDKALEIGYEKRGNVHYLVDEHIDEIQGC